MGSGSDFLAGGLLGTGELILKEMDRGNQEAALIRKEQRAEEARIRAEQRQQAWQKTYMGLQTDEAVRRDEELASQRYTRVMEGDDPAVAASIAREKGVGKVRTQELMRRKALGLPIGYYGGAGNTEKGLTGAQARAALHNALFDELNISEADAGPNVGKGRPSYFDTLSDPSMAAEVYELMVGEDLNKRERWWGFIKEDDTSEIANARRAFRAELAWMMARGEEPALDKLAKNNVLDADAPYEVMADLIQRADAGLDIVQNGLARVHQKLPTAGTREAFYKMARSELYAGMGYEESNPRATAPRKLWAVYKNGLDDAFDRERD